MKKIPSALLLALLLGLSGLTAVAQTTGTPLTTQLIITRVLPDGLNTPTPTVAIDGLNFNATTSRVFLGTAGGLFQELTVQSRTATKIVAELTTSAPGGYVLKVSAGTAAAQNFSVDLSLGFAGAAGADGNGFLFRQAFQTGAAYLTNDVVSYSGSTYVAIQDFIAAATPDADSARWSLFVAQGAPGVAGSQGPQGVTGATGPAGATGAAGPQGKVGSIGATGAQGLQGVPGTTGATGLTGPQGIPGSNNPTGNITLLESTSADVGNIFKGGAPFIHSYGNGNTFIGKNAGNFTMTGIQNTASGFNALQNNTTGSANIASGFNALQNNTTGTFNTASGTFALSANTTGGGNTALGSNANVSSGNLTNATAIGFNARVNASNKIRLGDGAVTVLEAQVGLTVVSDRNAKEGFLTPNAEDILQKIATVPVTTWNYIGHDPKVNRHYGPMAQDFFAAFGHDGVGQIGDDISINSSDLSGILMVAVQALEKRTAELTRQNAELQARLEKLESLLVSNSPPSTSYP